MRSRLSVAKMFVQREDFDAMPFVVDDISNEGSTLYQSLPERLYIIQHGKISYRGGHGPFGYRLYEVVGWVVDYCESTL